MGQQIAEFSIQISISKCIFNGRQLEKQLSCASNSNTWTTICLSTRLARTLKLYLSTNQTDLAFVWPERREEKRREEKELFKLVVRLLTSEVLQKLLHCRSDVSGRKWTDSALSLCRVYLAWYVDSPIIDVNASQIHLIHSQATFRYLALFSLLLRFASWLSSGSTFHKSLPRRTRSVHLQPVGHVRQMTLLIP